MKLTLLFLLLLQVSLAQEPNTAAYYNQLAKQAAKAKNYTQAILQFKKEKSFYSPQNSSSALAKCSYNLSVLYRTVANYPKAIEESQQTIHYCQQQYGTTHKETLDAHILHIKNLYKNYQLQATQLAIKKTLTTFKDSLNTYPSAQHKLLILEANILTEQGQYQQAEQRLQELSKHTKDHKTLATIYNNIGALKEYQQLNQQALQYYLKVLNLKKRIYTPNHPELAIIYHNLGTVNFKLKALEDAQQWFEQSYAINQQHYGKEHDQTAKDLVNLGSIYYEQKALTKAKQQFLAAIKIYTKIWKNNKSIKMAIPLQKLAFIEASQKNYNQAIRYYQQNLQLNKQFYPKGHPDILKAYINIGNLYQHQRQFKTAIALYQVALQDKPASSFWTLTILKQLLFCLLQEGNYQAVYQNITPALQQIQNIHNKWKQDVDQQQFLSLIANICEYGLTSCQQLYAQNPHLQYLEKALNLIECNKALSLTKVWQDRQWNQQLGRSDSLIESSHQLLVQINHWEQEWAHAQNKKDSAFSHYCSQQLFTLQQQLDQLALAPKQLHWQQATDTAQLKQIQQQLAPKNVLLNYFYGQQKIYCLSLSKDSIIFNSIAIDSSFSTTYKAYLKNLQDLNLAKENLSLACQKYQEQSTELYKTLVASCLPYQDIQQLLVSPDGLLYYLPFAALTQRNTVQPKGFHQLSYCINAYPISYIHSAQLWIWQQQHQTTPNSSILGLAPLSYPIQLDSTTLKLPKLSATQKELNYLKTNFTGHFLQNSIAIQQELEQHSILHLATHAWADAHNPLNAYLVVGEQQVLPTYRLAQFSLKADLVVLSACETGLGKFQQGEGVLSIARGFVYAGVPSIVLTLWTVNDESSYELVRHFYAALDQKQNKAEAIQTAQQQYILHSSAFRGHPFFWAAYEVWGDTQSLTLHKKSKRLSLWLFGGLGLLCLGIIIIIKKPS